ncbi:MAG TPA: HIT family protein [Candidatus Omnitrophica bacterium]|nr:HIT family protein [Candidatus Omnitrophota bacterium]
MKMEDCIFCNIIKGKIPSKKVYDGPDGVAFLDINPRNPGHVLVVPREHYRDIRDIPYNKAGELFKVVKRVSIAIMKGMKADGISIAQSNGSASGQVINHMHFHLIPRFANEDPVSIEGILPVKNIDEKTQNRIVKDIVKNL